MKLSINLATRVYVNVRQVNLVLSLSFLVCLCWFAFVLYGFTDQSVEMNRLAEIVGKKSAIGEGKAVSVADYNKFVAAVKAVNGIIEKRAYDWLALLDHLEQLVPTGVMLTSLDRSEKEETVKLSGTASSFSAIRMLMENLEGSKAFSDIYLTNQTTTRLENKAKAINFTITCKAATS